MATQSRLSIFIVNDLMTSLGVGNHWSPIATTVMKFADSIMFHRMCHQSCCKQAMQFTTSGYSLVQDAGNERDLGDGKFLVANVLVHSKSVQWNHFYNM